MKFYAYPWGNKLVLIDIMLFMKEISERYFILTNNWFYRNLGQKSNFEMVLYKTKTNICSIFKKKLKKKKLYKLYKIRINCIK